MSLIKEKYGNKKLLMASSDSTGCGGYRILFPHNFLQPNFEWTQCFMGFPSGNPIINEADIVVIQRATHEFFQQWIPWMQSQGKKIIYDIDDDLWHIPASNLAHRHYNKAELKQVESIIKICDCVTTSTIPLKNWLETLTDKQVFVIPNHVWHHEMVEKPKNDKIKIGWAGSYTHNGDFDHNLIKYLRSLPTDKVEISCVGFMPQFMKGFANLVPWIDFADYHKSFINLNWDIGVIVAEENTFNTCKSNIKYLEYSQAKCVSVAHNVYPYATTIDDGVDGFLVKNTKHDWKNYINQLIEDEPFRLQMANAAYEKVKQNFTYEFDSAIMEQRYIEVFDYLFKGE